MDQDALLLEEFRVFNESILRNEELGERRVSLYMALVTAAIGAFFVLPDKEQASWEPWLVSLAFVVVLSFGVLTFMRLIHRDYVTEEYKEIVDFLRRKLQLRGDLPYAIPFRERRPWYLRGGLSLTVAVMNTLIATAIGVYAAMSGNPMLLWLFPVVTFSAAAGLQWWMLSNRQHDRSERFRAGVGAVIFNSANQVLALQRSQLPGAWQMPQGGVNCGESLEEALFREICEETGLQSGDLGPPAAVPTWIGYELPPKSRSKKTGRGQVHMWYFVRLKSADSAIRLPPNGEFVSWRWDNLKELSEMAVEFRRPVYAQLLKYAEASGWHFGDQAKDS